MYISGFVGLILVIMSILIIVGVLGLSNTLVGGMFLVMALGLFGPVYDKYGRAA